jgi:hypothetical protein
MGKLDGPSTAAGGVLKADLGTTVTTADFALGAGWGGTATKAVLTGSNVQCGTITVTASATTPAQATATIVFTFPTADGARTVAPHFLVTVTSSSAIDEGHVVVVDTTTTSTWTFSVLPVAGAIYIFRWISVSRG